MIIEKLYVKFKLGQLRKRDLLEYATFRLKYNKWTGYKHMIALKKHVDKSKDKENNKKQDGEYDDKGPSISIF